jgi:hypothetical protein
MRILECSNVRRRMFWECNFVLYASELYKLKKGRGLFFIEVNCRKDGEWKLDSTGRNLHDRKTGYHPFREERRRRTKDDSLL